MSNQRILIESTTNENFRSVLERVLFEIKRQHPTMPRQPRIFVPIWFHTHVRMNARAFDWPLVGSEVIAAMYGVPVIEGYEPSIVVVDIIHADLIFKINLIP